MPSSIITSELESDALLEEYLAPNPKRVLSILESPAGFDKLISKFEEFAIPFLPKPKEVKFPTSVTCPIP